jgi:O-acetyl-ADP-ribose deacetylase (regulator of RNase III)
MNVLNQNLLSVKKGIIAHQVNCQGKMGAGLAKQLRAKYPQVYHQYINSFKTGKLQLGTVQLVPINQDLYVANLAGQNGYGTQHQQTDYHALTQCLIQLQNLSQKLELIPYLPYKIGCGLAGGDWQIVSSLIIKYCPSAWICQIETATHF